MATLRQASERLKLLNESEIVNRLFKILKDNEPAIIQAQKLQWDNNISRNNDLFSNYATSTEEYWRFKDPPAPENFSYKVASNNYNLKWSNDLRNNLFLYIKDNEANIISNMKESALEKIELLKRIEAMGLTEEHLNSIIQNYLLPELLRQNNETLGL